MVGGGGGAWKDRQGGRRDSGTSRQNRRGWWSPSWGHGCPTLRTPARKACSVMRGREGGGTGRSRTDSQTMGGGFSGDE